MCIRSVTSRSVSTKSVFNHNLIRKGTSDENCQPMKYLEYNFVRKHKQIDVFQGFNESVGMIKDSTRILHLIIEHELCQEKGGVGVLNQVSRYHGCPPLDV